MIPYLVTFAWLALLAVGTIIHARICRLRALWRFAQEMDRNLAAAKARRPKRREAGKKAYVTKSHNQYLRDPLVKEMRW